MVSEVKRIQDAPKAAHEDSTFVMKTRHILDLTEGTGSRTTVGTRGPLKNISSLASAEARAKKKWRSLKASKIQNTPKMPLNSFKSLAKCKWKKHLPFCWGLVWGTQTPTPKKECEESSLPHPFQPQMGGKEERERKPWYIELETEYIIKPFREAVAPSLVEM